MEVHTTEHILAALYGLGIDNALIEMDGPEVPILDGSAKLFVEAIESAGIIDQEAEKDFFCLLYTSDAADDSLRVDLGGRRIIKKSVSGRATC